MQSLICIRSGKAIVQNKTLSYTDTYEHFLLDGGEKLPNGLKELDFNFTLHTCLSLGECPEKAIHEYVERMLNKLPSLVAAFDARKAISDAEAVAQSFAKNDQEAKERAEKEALEHWQNVSLADYKQERLNELSREAAAFENNLNTEMYFTSSLGFKVNGDRRTKANLQDLITFFDLQANDGTLPYRDYDNKNRNLTKQQLQLLLVEHVANGNNLYEQKWAYQNQVSQAKNKDTLKAIKFTFEMADYSKVPLPSTLTKF